MIRERKAINIMQHFAWYGCMANDLMPEWEPERLGEPTEALPGSDEKKKVLAERAWLGQDIFHPEDRMFFDE